MPQGHSPELRERLVQALASGLSPAEIQRVTGVNPNSISCWKRKQAAGASLEPRRAPGPRHTVRRDDEPALQEQDGPMAAIWLRLLRKTRAGHRTVTASTAMYRRMRGWLTTMTRKSKRTYADAANLGGRSIYSVSQLIQHSTRRIRQ